MRSFLCTEDGLRCEVCAGRELGCKMAKESVAKHKAKAPKVLKLEDVLMNCRNYMRGKAGNERQRDIILTLVFIKFLGDKFAACRAALQNEVDNGKRPSMVLDMPAAYGQYGVIYLSENCRWETVRDCDAVHFALTADKVVDELNKDKRIKDALPPKIFSDSHVDGKIYRGLAQEIDKISPVLFKEKDLIGRVYEYFLQAFSINAEKEEGEFYTPHSIVETIAAFIEPYDGIIYDPCCGSGGMFVQAAKFVEAHGGNKTTIQVYGQESNPETLRLAKMNLAIRGISSNLGDYNASTFQNDLHPGLLVDYVMANPPFNLKKWRTATELTDDPRWSGYGLPPMGNANYAWILHILSKLKTSGMAGFLLANGALNDEDTVGIRKQLVENDKIEAIVILPREMFYSTDISVTLWILSNSKKACSRHGRKLRNRENEILFMDLRTWNENIYEKKFVQFIPEQIERAAKIYHTWQTAGTDGSHYEEPELYRSVGKAEIAKNGYSLTPSRYIEFVDRDLTLDYKKILKEAGAEVSSLVTRDAANQKALKAAFEGLGLSL